MLESDDISPWIITIFGKYLLMHLSINVEEILWLAPAFTTIKFSDEFDTHIQAEPVASLTGSRSNTRFGVVLVAPSIESKSEEFAAPANTTLAPVMLAARAWFRPLPPRENPISLQ
jgi:hypothetical protein